MSAGNLFMESLTVVFPGFRPDPFLSERAISLLSGCSRAHSLPRAEHRAKLRRKHDIVYRLRAGGDIPNVVNSISKYCLRLHLTKGEGGWPQHLTKLWVIVREEFGRYSWETRDALIDFLYSPACYRYGSLNFRNDPREKSPGDNYYWKRGKWIVNPHYTQTDFRRIRMIHLP